MLRIYIAGPIMGMEDGNRKAFAARAEALVKAGYEPLSPWDVPADHDGPCIGDELDQRNEHRYGCYLRADLLAMMYCDGITLLDGWEQSRGAKTELHVARSLGLQIVWV